MIWTKVIASHCKSTQVPANPCQTHVQMEKNLRLLLAKNLEKGTGYVRILIAQNSDNLFQEPMMVFKIITETQNRKHDAHTRFEWLYARLSRCIQHI